MTPEMKKTLLTRKFSSIEYMQELEHYMEQAIQGLIDALDYFDQHCQHIDMSTWQPAEKPEAWRDRALPNFNRILSSTRKAIVYAKQGDLSYIEGVTGSMQGLSKDMDVLSDRWVDYIPKDVAYAHGIPMGKARKIASNIWRTVGEYWKSPESVLKETITGPIDEQDLLRYLQPGEQV